MLEGTGAIRVGSEVRPVEVGTAVFIPGNTLNSCSNTGASDLRLSYIFAARSSEEIEYVFEEPRSWRDLRIERPVCEDVERVCLLEGSRDEAGRAGHPGDVRGRDLLHPPCELKHLLGNRGAGGDLSSGTSTGR